MRCTLPAAPLYSDTVPSDGDTGATTWFATVSPAVKFRFDAFGRAPLPHTVTNPSVAGLVTVTFMTTAETAPVAGTPA
jgi:hypothetical protein